MFYFTHLLYAPYWILLILHAPEFWKWILAPGIIFLLELTYRMLTSWLGKGKTTISAGVVLPSRVTNLIIKRPHNFTFSPGDWVFVKVRENCKKGDNGFEKQIVCTFIEDAE